MIVPFFVLTVIAGTFAVELQTDTFVTQLDHFRPQDDRTVNFTYASNFEHYRPGGPFYVYIKDVFDRSTQWIESGLMVDIARNTSGALFTYDPRYFGENIPTESADLDSLQYMTPEQALQDLATFIEEIRRRQAYSARIILWGSGYGGTVATWARKKFPHLVNAAWSSSGVFDIHIETLGLYDTLAYTIHRAAGYDCRQRVQQAFEELSALVDARNSTSIAETLGLCAVGDLDDPQEVGLLFESYLRNIIDHIEAQHTHGVQQFCDSMRLPAGRPLQALGRWVNYAFGDDRCLVIDYAQLVAVASRTEWTDNANHAAMRSAVYLQCTQTGLFQITDDVTWLPNRISLEFHRRRCVDILGERFNFKVLQQANDAVSRTYGSLYQSVSNVLYTNGMIDPWFAHAIVYSSDPSTVVVNIEHVARSADLTSIRTIEPSALNQAKHIIFDQIVRWSRTNNN